MKTLAGFHAVKGRLKQKADSVREIYVDPAVSDYIVRLVAEAHGGSVSAHNLPQGQGVEFVMRLPAPN